MADIEGVSDLKVEQQVLVPQLNVRLKPTVAEQFGLTPGDVRRAATTLIKGRTVWAGTDFADRLGKETLGRALRAA